MSQGLIQRSSVEKLRQDAMNFIACCPKTEAGRQAVMRIRERLCNVDRLSPAGYASNFATGAIARTNDQQLGDACCRLIDAMRFSADVSMTCGQSVPLVPKNITIVARTSSIAYQGFWGKCINNMSGFVPPSGPVPLDFGHDTTQVVGVADSMSIVNGELIASGRLIPFAPGDGASEIIFKGSQGIPYQASVNMDLGSLVFHELMEGQTEIVNGNEFSGPGYVFDEWTINGIAILPYGADSDTSVQFGGKPVVKTRATKPNIPASVRF